VAPVGGGSLVRFRTREKRPSGGTRCLCKGWNSGRGMEGTVTVGMGCRPMRDAQQSLNASRGSRIGRHGVGRVWGCGKKWGEGGVCRSEPIGNV